MMRERLSEDWLQHQDEKRDVLGVPVLVMICSVLPMALMDRLMILLRLIVLVCS
jgi:hypothetical protein